MAGKHKIKIDQGSTFRLPTYYRQPLTDLASGDAILDELDEVIAGPPNDLTGYTARMVDQAHRLCARFTRGARPRGRRRLAPQVGPSQHG